MRIDHITIATDDLDATVAFYRDVLGLEVGPRPAFPFAGAWLYAGGRPIVHLKAPGVQRADSALDHVAFYTDDFSSFITRLNRMHLNYKHQVLPDGSLRQTGKSRGTGRAASNCARGRPETAGALPCASHREARRGN